VRDRRSTIEEVRGTQTRSRWGLRASSWRSRGSGFRRPGHLTGTLTRLRTVRRSRAPRARNSAPSDRYVRRYVARSSTTRVTVALHGLQRRDFFGARHRGGDGQQRRKAAFQGATQPRGPQMSVNGPEVRLGYQRRPQSTRWHDLGYWRRSSSRLFHDTGGIS